MTLPDIARASAVVELDGGHAVTVRGLSRGESLQISRLSTEEDVLEMEVAIIAFGTDTPIEDARAWHRSVPFQAVQPVIDRIVELSGLNGLGKVSSEG